jgi:hypothetical protein
LAAAVPTKIISDATTPANRIGKAIEAFGDAGIAAFLKLKGQRTPYAVPTAADCNKVLARLRTHFSYVEGEVGIYDRFTVAVREAVNVEKMPNLHEDMDVNLFRNCLFPAISLTAMSKKISDGALDFRTRANVRIDLINKAIGAIATLRAMLPADPTQTAYQNLTSAITKLRELLSASFDAAAASTMHADVIDTAKSIREQSARLAQTNHRLSLHLGAAKDLDATYRVDKASVDHSRHVFYAWLIAFVCVLVIGVFLVATGRLSLFMLFGGATLTIVTLALVFAWVVRAWKRRGHRSVD